MSRVKQGLRRVGIVFRKELLDAWRDARTLVSTLLTAVAIGPLVLLAFALLTNSVGKYVDERQVMLAAPEASPTLARFLRQQGFEVSQAPSGYERQLDEGTLTTPVLVLQPGFEALLEARRPARVDIRVNGSSIRARLLENRVGEALRKFQQAQQELRLDGRGIDRRLVDVLDVHQQDVAVSRGLFQHLASVIPFFVVMAVLNSAMHMAIDMTAGENERQSLDALLASPISGAQLLLGKWAAATLWGVAIVGLSCASFLPMQFVFVTPGGDATMRYGIAQVAAFGLLLAPLVGAVVALTMAIGVHGASVKQAHANTTIVLLMLSLLPLAQVFGSKDQSWYLWVPALAQTALMSQLLKGQPVSLLECAVPAVLALLIAALCLTLATRGLGRDGRPPIAS